MIRRFRSEMRRVAIWTAVLSLSLLPFVHTHAGVTSSHTGGHAHPPVVHSVFASDETAHPPAEPQRPTSSEALATAPHDLGYEIESLSGTTTTPMALEAGKVVVLPTVPSTQRLVPAESSPPAGIIETSSASRAPPFFSLS